MRAIEQGSLTKRCMDDICIILRSYWSVVTCDWCITFFRISMPVFS